MLYYQYCVKLHRSDYEFWHSTLGLISKMIDIYADEVMMKTSEGYESKYFRVENQLPLITSMSQMTV